MRAPLYYQASGNSSPLCYPLVLLGAVPVAMLLAVVYAYAIVYIPIAGYVTFILSAGFGALAGVCAGFALRRGKVRSTVLATGLTAVVALSAFYFHWVVWCYALLSRNDVDVSFLGLWLFPPALFEVIGVINDTGAWTMFSTTPTGWALWTLWFLEALLILVPAMLLGVGMVMNPFCEQCERWCDEQQGLVRLTSGEPETVRALAEAKKFSDLSALGAVEATTPAHLRVDLWSCPRCRDMSALSIHAIVRTVDDKGKESEDATALVEHLLLTRSELDQARELANARSVHAPVLERSLADSLAS